VLRPLEGRAAASKVEALWTGEMPRAKTLRHTRVGCGLGVYPSTPMSAGGGKITIPVACTTRLASRDWAPKNSTCMDCTLMHT
jgi:hypothetical protein